MTEAVQPIAAVEPTSAENSVEKEPEKLVPQSKVSEIAGSARHQGKLEGIEEGRKAALAELKLAGAAPSFGQQPMSPTPQAPQAAIEPAPQGMGGMPAQLSLADVERLVNERMQQHQTAQQQHNDWQQTANQFLQKAQRGISKYPGFEDGVKTLDLERNKHLVYLTNHVDNTEDVLKELIDNPGKVAMFNELSRNNPHLAIKGIQDLSNSIKTNQSAAQSLQSPNEPLSQIKPSTATPDNGVRTVADLRKLDYLRG